MHFSYTDVRAYVGDMRAYWPKLAMTLFFFFLGGADQVLFYFVLPVKTPKEKKTWDGATPYSS
jgi:hypothetical protein